MTAKSTGCGFDPHSEIKYLLKFLFLFSFSSLWCRSKPFGGKWGGMEEECGLNTRFPRPTLLCAGYTVKLKKKLRPICTLEIWEHYLLNCRVTYTLILNEKGGVEADLTVTILDGGSGPLHEPIFKVRLSLVFYINTNGPGRGFARLNFTNAYYIYLGNCF